MSFPNLNMKLIIFQYFFQRVARLPIEVEANTSDEQDTNITTDKATVAQVVATY